MSDRQFSLSELEPIIDEVLLSGADVTFVASGVSMQPYIKDKIDKVTITNLSSDPQKGDVVLYKRENGRFVLHRIVGVGEQGYIMRGDNQWFCEYPIKKESIKAILKSVEHNGKVRMTNGLQSKLYYKFLALIRFKLKVMNFIKYRYNKHFKSRSKQIK